MGYLIELSVNLNQSVNINEIKNALIDKAEECKVETYYSIYEFMGQNRHVYRKHYVLTFKFEEHEELVALFIKYINTLHHVSIESIGYDNLIFKLMYASKKYLNMMEKYQAKKYLEDKKNGKLYKQDSIILKSILKKNK